jgi:hypothetical protein
MTPEEMTPEPESCLQSLIDKMNDETRPWPQREQACASLEAWLGAEQFERQIDAWLEGPDAWARRLRGRGGGKCDSAGCGRK